MRFVAKLIVLLLSFSLLYLVPGGVGAGIRCVVLISLSCLLIISIAAARDLGILRFPSLAQGRSGRGDGSANPKYVSYNGIKVYYTMKLSGGGLGLSYEFVRLVSKHIGKVGHVYEYCAGPGFIGFNLLANDLCDRLTLSDINPDAIEVMKRTIKENGIEDRVSVYQSDCLDSIPNEENWDLIVSNPPWDIRSKDKTNFILSDPSARIHSRLFQDASKFLNANGSILLVESHEYTRYKDMLGLVQGRNLKIAQYFSPGSLLNLLSVSNESKITPRFVAITLRLARILLEIYFIRLKPASAPCQGR